MAEEPPPTNVIQAIARVMAELPAIGKNSKADPKMGGYAFRGIEAITAEAQKLQAKYCVVFVPRVTECEIKDILVNDKPWTDTILHVEYDIYGPQGISDKIVCGPLIGIGRDNSDKGANKALTQSYKYALIETYCISDSTADADGQSHERDAAAKVDPVAPAAKADFDKLVALIKATDPAGESEKLASHIHGKFGQSLQMTHEQVKEAIIIAENWPPPREDANVVNPFPVDTF